MNELILSLSTRIQADESVHAIAYAAGVLRRDLRDGLTGHGPANVIRVVLDPSLEAETYLARVTEQEILLQCGDDLGAVYALLSISERYLGVRPLGWWMGLKAPVKETVTIPCGTWASPKYAVRYRCWFVNDEVLLTGWHLEESQRAEVWKRLFEALLRCGGNMVIPGTDREYDGHQLCDMALERGLWITQHHTELLGARMFARAYPELQPSYTQHPQEFEKLWQEAIDRYAGKRVVWTIGFRGQGDKAFWHDDAGYDTAEKQGAFISSVMRRQMELVRARDPKAVFSTNLYGEMMGLYRQGFLQVPDGVIRLWGDNGYGKMVSRRQNNDNPRVDAMPSAHETGEHGIYYHVSFYDLQAANHITMLQNPPQMIADELKSVLERNAGTLWNINVGSVKPHTFMLEIVRRMWTDGQCDARRAAEDFARDYYGDAAASDLLLNYAECAVQYGPNADDRAGDQYYHFPLRTMIRALMRGEYELPIRSLLWAAGKTSYLKQVETIARIGREGMESWGRYVRACREVMDRLPEAQAVRLQDTLLLQGTLHLTGCEGLYSFGQCAVHAVKGHDLQAYLWADRALEAHRRGLNAMRQVSGRFAHLYDNDCFAGVELTCRMLEGLRSWLRIRGDGDLMYDWEKQYLVSPEEKRVVLQTHRTVQLSDDELCLRLRGEAELEEAW